jgi:hypothetical protein
VTPSFLASKSSELSRRLIDSLELKMLEIDPTRRGARRKFKITYGLLAPDRAPDMMPDIEVFAAARYPGIVTEGES